MKEKIMKIDQEAMRYFDEKRQQAIPKVSIETLASMLYPDAPNGRMIIQRMRKPQANGKTRSMSLGEFVTLARSLNLSPLEALATILNRLEG